MDINNSFITHYFKKFWKYNVYSKIDYNSNKNPGPIFSKEKRVVHEGLSQFFFKSQNVLV